MIKCGQLAYPPPQTLYLTAVVTVVQVLLPKWTHRILLSITIPYYALDH